jgi:hypothetical protein
VEGIALDLGAADRGVQEIQVERRVVADEDGACAFRIAYGSAHLAEDALQRVVLGDGRTQRMVRIDAGDRERGGLEVRSGKGNDVIAVRLTARQGAVRAHLEEYHRDLEERIGLGVESARLQIHDDGQEAAKTRGERDGRGRSHARSAGARRHAIVSPAR